MNSENKTSCVEIEVYYLFHAMLLLLSLVDVDRDKLCSNAVPIIYSCEVEQCIEQKYINLPPTVK